MYVICPQCGEKLELLFLRFLCYGGGSKSIHCPYCGRDFTLYFPRRYNLLYSVIVLDFVVDAILALKIPIKVPDVLVYAAVFGVIAAGVILEVPFMIYVHNRHQRKEHK